MLIQNNAVHKSEQASYGRQLRDFNAHTTSLKHAFNHFTYQSIVF